MNIYGFVFAFYGRFGGVEWREFLTAGDSEKAAFDKAENIACQHSKKFEYWAFKTARKIGDS